MAMLFHDKSYASEYHFQFDSSAQLEEVELGKFEAYAHSNNLPLQIVFVDGKHVVRPPRKDPQHYRKMLAAMWDSSQ